MKKSVIAAIFISPFLWGCQGSAEFDTDFGTIDARKHAKECVELEKTNPKKIEINVEYYGLCTDYFYRSNPYLEKEPAYLAVTGYMKLLRQGIDISRVSTDQAMGKKPLKLTGNKSIWDQRTQTASLTDPYKIGNESKSNEVRTKQQYDGKYLFITGYISTIKEDGFWIQKGSMYSDNAVECEVRPDDRRFISELNKGDEVVAFGRYKFSNFMGLRGELSNCVWSAKSMKYQNFMSIQWLNTIDQAKAQKLIRSAPMYQGTIIEYREPTRNLDREGQDAFRKFLDG